MKTEDSTEAGNQKQDAKPLAGYGNSSALCDEPKNKCRKREKSMLFERSEFVDFSFKALVFSAKRMKS